MNTFYAVNEETAIAQGVKIGQIVLLGGGRWFEIVPADKSEKGIGARCEGYPLSDVISLNYLFMHGQRFAIFNKMPRNWRVAEKEFSAQCKHNVNFERTSQYYAQ
jgi:hypothetical protein